MAQGEEEIIIIGGGTKPRPKASGETSDYDIARQMIDDAEANGTPVRFEHKGKD